MSRKTNVQHRHKQSPFALLRVEWYELDFVNDHVQNAGKEYNTVMKTSTGLYLRGKVDL